MDNRHLHRLADFKSRSWIARTWSNFRAQRAANATSLAVVSWHVLLCAIAAVNVFLWSLSAIAVIHAQPATHAAAIAADHVQLILCAAYVFGCAYRCVLPVYDIPRVVLVDSRLSSVIVGRSVATIAELCFAVQWALMLHRMALLSDSLPAQAVSLTIVPLIVLAEVCSWYAVLTTAQRAHAFENSIWGVSAALVVAGLLLVEPSRVAGLYLPMIAWCVGGAAYVAYIFLFDVPAYWSRWRADRANGHRNLSIGQGVLDVCRRRIVSHRWEIWRNEIVWMSLYFTLGVWSSVSLVYASIMLGG
ncbi:MAG TPA: hypothetical protein VGM97_02700 [Steroidobacteraceae bacterium]